MHSPCLSPWERWLSEAKTERVNCDCQTPLSRLRRQLSQRESQEAVRIRTLLLISIAVSIDRTHSRHIRSNLIPTPTGGAYHSARKVTECECRSFQISFPPESHCGTHPTHPASLFFPFFSGKTEKKGPPEARQKRPRRNEPPQATSLFLCARFFLSKPQTEFAVWVFPCRSATTSQSASLTVPLDANQ